MNGAFDVFMIDPPWPKKKGGLRALRPHQGRELDYPTMPVPAIFNLLDESVFPLASPQHTVFLWCVDEFLFPAEAEMERRGYRRHARLIWNKENGVAPAFSVRFSHEYLIWFYRPKFTPVAIHERGKHMTVFSEKSRQHSRKPDAAYRMVDAIFPAARKLDVFSRESREGWETWGDQTDYFATAPSQTEDADHD
jgi:N6-adenosine-specific RNA methylase IME4